MSECGARASVDFTRSQALSMRECDSTKRERTKSARRRRECVQEEKKRERETVRAKGRERKKKYVNDFTNERPWDRRKCAGAPSSGWIDRMNVNAS